jgi:hypothetical protein
LYNVSIIKSGKGENVYAKLYNPQVAANDTGISGYDNNIVPYH